MSKSYEDMQALLDAHKSLVNATGWAWVWRASIARFEVPRGMILVAVYQERGVWTAGIAGIKGRGDTPTEALGQALSDVRGALSFSTGLSGGMDGWPDVLDDATYHRMLSHLCEECGVPGSQTTFWMAVAWIKRQLRGGDV